MKEEYSSYKFSEDFHLLSSRKKLSYDVAETLLFFLCFYPALVSAIYAAQFKNDVAFDGSILLFSLISMTVIKDKIKKPSLYIICTLLIISAGIILTWTEGSSVMYSIYLLCYGIYLVFKRFKGRNNFWRFSRLASMEFFLAVAYGIALLNKFILLQYMIFAFAVLILLIFTIYFHYSSGDKLLQWENYTEEKHIKNLKTINVIFSLIIIIVIGTSIVLAWRLGIFAKLDVIYNKIWNFLFAEFKVDNISQKKFKDMDMGINPLLQIQQNISKDTMNTTTFFKIIVFIIKTAFFAVIIVGIILIILVILQKLYNRHYRKFLFGEQVESTITKEDISEKLKTLKNPLNKLKMAVSKTNKDKLRRMYYQSIMTYKKKGSDIEMWNTPQEIESTVKAKWNGKLEKITELYEKFRYSTAEPTEEELKEMKELIKKYKSR